MSSSFQVSNRRGDVERGFSEDVPQRTTMRIFAYWLFNISRWVFHIGVNVFFMIRNFPAVQRDFYLALIWLLVNNLLMFIILSMCSAFLERHFNQIGNDTLRVLNTDTAANTLSMTEDEINSLPIRKYNVSGPTNDGSSSSSEAAEINQDSNEEEGSGNGPEEELTCTICMDQVKREEFVRSLPCFHQFHVECIDQWLRQQGTCPICKICMVMRRQGNMER